jgi:hypothetical protein
MARLTASYLMMKVGSTTKQHEKQALHLPREGEKNAKSTSVITFHSLLILNSFKTLKGLLFRCWGSHKGVIYRFYP